MRKTNTSFFFSFLLSIFLLQSCFDGGTGQLLDFEEESKEAKVEILPVDTVGMVSLSAYHNTAYYVTGGADNSLYLFVSVNTGALENPKNPEQDLSSVLGQEVQLNISIPEGVELTKVFGPSYENNKDKINLRLEDLRANETQTVLFKLNRDEQGLEDLSFSTELEYTDLSLNSKQSRLLINTVIQPTLDQSLLELERSTEVAQWIAFYKANKQLGESINTASNGDLVSARIKLEESEAYLNAEISKWGISDQLAAQAALVERFDVLLSKMVSLGTKDQDEIQKTAMDNMGLLKKKTR